MLTRLAAQVGFVLLLGIAGAASTGAVTIATGLGVDVGYACLDGATSCFGERDFDLVGIAPAAGTVDLTGGPFAWLIDIDLDVVSLTMEDTSGTVDGVDRLEFADLTFVVTGWDGFDFGGGVVTGAGTVLGTVTGNYEQFSGATSVVGSTAFNESVSFSNFACDASGVGLCGFEVGFVNTVLFPGLVQPVGVTSGGTDHQFVWTFNVILAPEPSTATLLGVGLVGLCSVRRRRD